MTIVIVVNLFGNADLENAVESIKNIKASPEPIHIVLSWSNPSPNAPHIIFSLKKTLSNKFSITYLSLPKMGLGRQRDSTLRFVLHKFADVRYIIYIEEDVIV